MTEKVIIAVLNAEIQVDNSKKDTDICFVTRATLQTLVDAIKSQDKPHTVITDNTETLNNALKRIAELERDKPVEVNAAYDGKYFADKYLVSREVMRFIDRLPVNGYRIIKIIAGGE